MYNRMTKMMLLAFPLFLLGSCAKKYNQLSMNTLQFNNSSVNEGIEFSYRYNVLDGNEKYTKKEAKKNIALVGIKIKNTTKDTLRIGQELGVYTGNNKTNVLQAFQVVNELKQSVPAYLLYLLLTPLNLYIEDGNGRTTYPIGLILGPSISVGNMIVAGNANKKFKKNVMDNYLLGVPIYPGETKSGLIGLRHTNFDPINIVIEK